MIINHNMNAMNAHRNMSSNTVNAGKSMEKLSSGLRINKAGDDAAGLAISEKMRGQIRGLDQASRNAQDGISMIQTAEGALNETHSILQRMRELAVQSANDTNVSVDRKEIQKEIDQLASEITRIGNNTEFNTQKLVNGQFEGTFQIGANKGQNLSLKIEAMDAFSLKLTEDVKSVSAHSITNGSSNTADVIGADIEGAQYLTEGDYSVEVTQNADGTTFDIALKNSNGDVVAKNEGYTAAAGPVTLDTEGDGSGTDIITLSFDAAMDAGDTATLKIGASGLDLNETQDAGNTGSIVAVEASATDLLESGSYTATVKTDASSNVYFELTDSNGKVLGTSTASASSFTADTVETINLTSGGTINLTIDTTGSEPADGDFFEFTATKSDYKSGASSAATTSKDAVSVKGIDVSSQTAADAAVTTIQNAIETVSAERSKLGAYQNRLEHTIANLGTSSENLTAAESRVRDVDMAKEMMNFSKNNILSQAAQAMLAQANQQPQGVLQLLR